MKRHRCEVCDVRSLSTANLSVYRRDWEIARSIALSRGGWTASAVLRHAIHEYLEGRMADEVSAQ